MLTRYIVGGKYEIITNLLQSQHTQQSKHWLTYWLIDWLIIQGFDERGSLKQTKMTLDPVIITPLLGMTISEVQQFQRKLRNGRFTEATIYWNKMTLDPLQTKLRNGGFTGITLYWINKMSLDPLITYWEYHNFRGWRISNEVEEWRVCWKNPLLNQQDESGSSYNLLGIWQFQRLEDFKRSWGIAGLLE
jgi:hypothetical protein